MRPLALFKTLMPQTLFGRALVILITPMVLLQLIAGYVFYDRLWETVTRRLAGGLAGDIAFVTQTYIRADSDEDRRWLIAFSYDIAGLRVSVKPGIVLTPMDESGLRGLERHLARALAERVRRPVAFDVWSQPREVIIDVQLPGEVLSFRAGREQIFTSTVYVFILWVVGSSLILFAIASVFMRNQVRPIRRLARAAEAFGKGRDVASFQPHGAAEVRQAAAAFIDMRERIRRHLTQRTEMLAGVSHDLRTPLTRMKLELAMLPESPAITGLRSDVGEMERMVDSYLDFVRGEGEEKVEETDLGQILSSLVQGARRNGHAVSLEAEGDLRLPLRPQAMRRCVSNLLANAIRHGTRVAVTVKRGEGATEIMVDDDGPGVPADQREAVFKPFFRLEGSRNPATGGVGLGLTIARDVARGHGGDLVLAESPLGGLRATIRLPQ